MAKAFFPILFSITGLKHRCKILLEFILRLALAWRKMQHTQIGFSL
jgi:hypothetical protein